MLISRLGRRKLMLFAAGGQCACMAILAGTVYDGGHAAGIVATVMLFLFNFFFGVGLLAVPWLRMSLLSSSRSVDQANPSSTGGICAAGHPDSHCCFGDSNKLYVFYFFIFLLFIYCIYFDTI